MSTKKQIAELVNKLEQFTDEMLEAVERVNCVREEIATLASTDEDKSDSTHGSVSDILTHKSEFLDEASDAINEAMEEVIAASGTIRYSLQDYDEATQ